MSNNNHSSYGLIKVGVILKMALLTAFLIVLYFPQNDISCDHSDEAWEHLENEHGSHDSLFERKPESGENITCEAANKNRDNRVHAGNFECIQIPVTVISLRKKPLKLHEGKRL